MKASQLKTFVEIFLEEQGAKIKSRGDQLLEVKLPKDLPLQWHSNKILLSFTQKAHQKEPESELMTIGHPFLENLFQLCRIRARYSIRYETLPRKKGRSPSKNRAPDLEEGWSWSDPQAIFSPLIYMAYIIQNSTMEAPDDLETFLLDPWTGEHIGDGIAEIKNWEKGSAEPANERLVLPVPDMKPLLKWGLSILDQRLRKRVLKTKYRHELELKDEIGNIENYYRQLIEEVRKGNRRNQLTIAEREEKIRLLQLDWKRRIQEATEYLKPRTIVRLSAVGVLYRPRWGLQAMRVAVRSKSKDKRKVRGVQSWLVADHSGTDWRSTLCVECRKETGGFVVPFEGGFLCATCGDLEAGAAEKRGRRVAS
ncbi:MAG: hypothetical protein KJ970_12265 [Candidatus Eisenbacteria bacterium]|uniref:Uncharacterized protein n=1 Tax=Eiseniibacteriota bacterium TaxID=2212470 RepID=A0A948RYX1_UNCEI|nr:hypothetical protein [Candidatus Eisenbacteria bacterium]MBU1949430.1 hypothetical protein [Candidatus Eisenbacteria bacterium]MBU2691692.1 hypothetical protein [Candidatus Eisenbacteria bacterium]